MSPGPITAISIRRGLGDAAAVTGDGSFGSIVVFFVGDTGDAGPPRAARACGDGGSARPNDASSSSGRTPAFHPVSAARSVSPAPPPGTKRVTRSSPETTRKQKQHQNQGGD